MDYAKILTDKFGTDKKLYKSLEYPNIGNPVDSI